MHKFLLILGTLLLLAPPVLAQPGPGPGPGPTPNPWLVNGNVISYPGGVVAGSPTGAAPGSGTFDASAGYEVNGSRVAQSATGPLVLDPATGVISCPTCSTGTGGALTNGVTTTSGYTNTQILGSTGTVLSAYSVSGSGNVVLGNSPSITTPTINFGTGGASGINATSTNTGNVNQFVVSNQGTSSNGATGVNIFANLGALPNGFLLMSVAGGATPTAFIEAGSAMTGGLAISALGGPLNITNPVLSTPNIGVATGTSLALSGSLSAGGNILGGGLIETGTTSSSYLYVVPNSSGTFPVPGNGGAIGWNFASGVAEVDFWNTFTSSVPSASFAWRQQLTASTQNNLMQLLPNGSLNVLGTTASTSPTTGALTVLGGAGIAGQITIGGNVLIQGATLLGNTGVTDGVLNFTSATSGILGLRPPSGVALGTNILTLPAVTDTLTANAATQTLSNKTLASSTNVLGGVSMTLGSDATGDIYYRSSGGVLTRLPIGATGNLLNVSGGLPAWAPPTGGGNVSNSGTPTANQFALWTGSTNIQGVNAASKTDQQTPTSAILPVTPLHQQDHPSANKMNVSFTAVTGALLAGYNATGVTRTSTGVYTVNFTTPFSSAFYSCHVGYVGNNAVVTVQESTKTTGSIILLAFTNALAAADPLSIDIDCQGQQ